MAEEGKDSSPAGEAAAPKSGKRKLIALGGGGVGVLALAYLTALMALPREQAEPKLQGPFVAPLTEAKVQVNLAGSKSFLVVNFNLIYEAFDEAYYVKRSEDPVYVAELKDVLVDIASAKTREEFSDRVNKPVILEEIRQAVDPLLFPVHIGNGASATDKDPESGLAAGLSSHIGTFRPVQGEHFLVVDAIARTLLLGDGPEVTWTAGDNDVVVENALGQTLHVDVSQVTEGFRGKVSVGVRGRVRRLLWNEVLIQ